MRSEVMKRYEYRFDPVVFYKPFGIVESVQWRDTIYLNWLFSACQVFDHLENKFIKDRVGLG